MAKKRTKKRAPKKKRGGGDASGAILGVPGGGVEQRGAAPGREDEHRESPPCDEEQFERDEEQPELSDEKRQERDELLSDVERSVMVSTSGDLVRFSGSVPGTITHHFSSSERARILLTSLGFGWHGVGRVSLSVAPGDHPPLTLATGGEATDAKMKEGFERYIAAEDVELSPDAAYVEFRAMTEDILRLWDEQMSDGLGLIAFFSGGETDEGRLVNASTVMPCHPFDALVFLSEEHHALAREDATRDRETAIATDILDRLSPSQANFVKANNLLFRTLFVDYKNCSVGRFFNTEEDIPQDDLKRWKSLACRGEDEDIPLQKKDIPKTSIDMVAAVKACSQNKAVRLLKASEGDVIGALERKNTDGDRERRFKKARAEREYQCTWRTLMYTKLGVHILTNVLVQGCAGRFPISRGNGEFEDEIFMLADETVLKRCNELL